MELVSMLPAWFLPMLQDASNAQTISAKANERKGAEAVGCFAGMAWGVTI